MLPVDGSGVRELLRYSTNRAPRLANCRFESLPSPFARYHTHDLACPPHIVRILELSHRCLPDLSALRFEHSFPQSVAICPSLPIGSSYGAPDAARLRAGAASGGSHVRASATPRAGTTGITAGGARSGTSSQGQMYSHYYNISLTGSIGPLLSITPPQHFPITIF